MAADFSIQVGSSQPIVFRWLLDQLATMRHNDDNCSEVFCSVLCDRSISQLLTLLAPSLFLLPLFSSLPPQTRQDKSQRSATVSSPPSHLIDYSSSSQEHTVRLAVILSEKLRSYPREKQPQQEERHALHGYLETLHSLIQLDPQAVLRSQLGDHLFMESFLVDFLFCDTSTTRQAAFSVLSSYLSISMDGFETVLNELNKLSRAAARYMKPYWGLQVSHDIKKPDVQFSGLKNQGWMHLLYELPSCCSSSS